MGKEKKVLLLAIWKQHLIARNTYIFLFIEFIGVTLVNGIIQISGAQFHKTSSVHCVFITLSRLSSTICPLCTLLHSPPHPFWQSPQLSVSMSSFSTFSFLLQTSMWTVSYCLNHYFITDLIFIYIGHLICLYKSLISSNYWLCLFFVDLRMLFVNSGLLNVIHVIYQFACLLNVYGTFAISTKSFKAWKHSNGVPHSTLLFCIPIWRIRGNKTLVSFLSVVGWVLECVHYVWGQLF